ncbi:hypothetical protein DEB41_11200 [Vibrio anguillarum]|uniref:Uncharacterized protein n=3 Tax=Vibrio anguillarum TaxID=55601 RepID=A0AAW4AYW9_VIBAN|nr:hypothetical protein [Vibrio anguillarum]AEH33977.1 hypothetical protein VAA_00140 [Vibrio anguillarum 775]ASF91116.1 hypothetical protein CEA93_03420 [Vibrio anguillarum]ATA50208.1 hypothetical protein CLI14_10835 [Vibrio anguillarum]AXN08040.1 hypothetical protein DEA53_11395 [Vibrio anguillarum]AXN11443.1 hypothetical protein DEB26_11190 [Vibrio anguillarum]
MQTKVRIRKELFLAIYYNEHFSSNDLKSVPLDSDEKEYLSDEYVEKKLKEMSLIGAVLSCGFDKHGDEEFSKGFMFNHIDWEVVDYDNYSDDSNCLSFKRESLLTILQDKQSELSESYSLHKRTWKHFNRLCAQHSELRLCLDEYISEYDNRRLDLKAEMQAVENAITFYKNTAHPVESGN